MGTKKESENKKTYPLLEKWLAEWGLFLYAVTRPYFLFLLILTLLTAFVSNTASKATGIEKSIYWFLQAMIPILGAFVGAVFYEALRDSVSNMILRKKGVSAIRNLYLTRQRTKNISQRCAEKASMSEISNLLLLLEKDIVYATDEWKDILPGIENIQELFVVFEEKESKLEELAKKDKELEQKLVVAQEDQGSKEKVLMELSANRAEISELKSQISRLELLMDTLTSPVAGTLKLGQPYNSSWSGLSSLTQPYNSSSSWAKFCSLTQPYSSFTEKCSTCGEELINSACEKCGTCQG